MTIVRCMTVKNQTRHWGSLFLTLCIPRMAEAMVEVEDSFPKTEHLLLAATDLDLLL